MKRSHSQSELRENSQVKEPKLEDIDLTEDDCENSINDADCIAIPEVSMIECHSEDDPKAKESSLKITSIVSANHFDFNNEKYAKMIDNPMPVHQTCPNTDIIMYSSTSLLFENCIFNKNNVVATQQGLKTYW